MWKVKRLIKKLDTCRGNGTSVVTLILPPKKRIDDVQKMLTEEIGAAQHIKSRLTKQSVCTAITSTQQKLKLYKNVPENARTRQAIIPGNVRCRVKAEHATTKTRPRSRQHMCDNYKHMSPKTCDNCKQISDCVKRNYDILRC